MPYRARRSRKGALWESALGGLVRGVKKASLKHDLLCEGGFLIFGLRVLMLGQPRVSRLVARSVLVTGSPCSLQGLCVAQRHRLGDLLAVRFDDALLACVWLRSLDETIRDRTEACG